MPAPESCTETSTRSFASRCVRITSSRERSDDAVHGFQPVQHQIEHDLLQLHPIAEHARQVRAELRPQSRARPPRFSLGQCDDLSNDLIDVQRLLLGRRAAREGANPRDDVARTAAVAAIACNPSRTSSRFGDSRSQKAQAGVRIDDDARERLVDLMRDRRRHFAQRRHAADMCELGLRLTQRLLRALLLRHVHDAHQHAVQIGAVGWKRYR